jgi:dipeptidyl aminopeptidase/acylaminoacyl peptidase
MITGNTKFLLLLALLGACKSANESSDEVNELQTYTIEQFMNTEQIGGSAFSPGEDKIMYSSKKTGIYNAYKVPVSGGEPVQLTDSESESIFAISYFPEDERILFSSDQGGNEITHIFVKKLSGEITDLTPDSTAKAQFMGWAGDEQSFFFASNARNPQAFDVYELNIDLIDEIENSVAAYQPEMIFENDGRFYPGPISHDQKYMAVTESVTRQKVNMYLKDLESGELEMINDPDDEIAYSPQFFDKDGDKLYFLTDKGSEYKYLSSYDIASGKTQKVEEADWDIMYAYQSENGKYRVIGINEDAQTRIKIYNRETGEQVALPDVPDGEITSVNISDSEELMAFYVNSATSPNNLYVHNFESGETSRLTDTMNPEIDESDLVSPEVVRYKSFDGMEIPAILYQPKMASTDNPVPAIVSVHGGPGGQSRLGYNALIQYLANHGYAVLQVNNRGSSGYGKTFFTADDQKHGEDDLKDVVYGKEYLAGLANIDSQRIGVMGGSYGGYMTLAALTFEPEVFEVGVDIFGVSNWLRTLKSIPAWWGAARESLYNEMGNPETDSTMLYNKSPLFFADQIQKPLMVLQGANDPRVLKVESDEIVEKVKQNDVPVEYVVFDDEGHGFRKKENQIKGYQAILEFLNRYLKEDVPVEASI